VPAPARALSPYHGISAQVAVAVMRNFLAVQKILCSTNEIEAGISQMLLQPGAYLYNADITQGLRLRDNQMRVLVDGAAKMGLVRRVSLTPGNRGGHT